MGAPISKVVQPGHAHFVMIEKEALFNLDELMQADMQAARLFMSLARLLEPGSGGVVVASNQAMQEMLDVSPSTVARALRTLVKGEFVRRVRVGGAHALAINQEFAWVGKQDDKQYAVFPAMVIASRAEQMAADLKPGKPKHMPLANRGEHVLPVGAEPDPPAQGLIEGTEPVALVGDAAERAELEQRGQQRLGDL